MRRAIRSCDHTVTLCILVMAAMFPATKTGAQTVTQKLQKAFLRFEEDSQLAHAISSLYVIDAGSGKVVFDKNAQTGLAPASTQKIITSAAAFALLGQDFRYQTKFGIAGNNLYILPSGDPTLGSERWQNTKADKTLERITGSLRQNRLHINAIYVDNKGWAHSDIPDGWMWQDIGNYYGAGAEKLNWRENQYDLLLQSGKNIGDPVRIAGTHPKLFGYTLHSMATAAARGTGDNAYIYFPLNDTAGIVKGTIPVNENGFGISGAFPSGAKQFIAELANNLVNTGIADPFFKAKKNSDGEIYDYTIIHTETSPPLDSIIYWFNKKSINLYGEALLKTMAYEKKGYSATDTGVNIVKNFWKQNGIDPAELNIADGSGLSPLNRVTAHAQVEILKYARQQSWFSSFYHSLPEYNGMKMKSGTIRNVKGFTGYHTSGDGRTYIFSFLVNNYNGAASALVRKMYTVLNVLK
ncbi:D-alanyl-D-alanine carboxypeptidase/D-alanyl-D-alanine-endopeptidase [Agriterribacter sp.]|uniref:D-alanyl-D-alanine carboxypeptidase/D-alanyl-D-alanine endopeptidase n=1 Tax=Agriterribacter sp. TaxID=2821509 RepID=UPI002B5C9BE9|nr:D-alanyl-D-alanine carboxypeptidase/D-alanyl-D-alanine-endopeptidase [Agriterribacter sp.]HRP56578.1 D-alanyl-D-alanine carboxypeptidase/D-alanyl-D-alanine-endopeptidase [Agriterribacter sp.]